LGGLQGLVDTIPWRRMYVFRYVGNGRGPFRQHVPPY
jgi:hypothetical protein